MKHLCIMMATLGSYTLAQLPLKVFINDEIVKWEIVEPETESANEGVVNVLFEGGKIEINLADYSTWDYAHVLGLRYQRVTENTYTFHTTVRHRDEGWDHYANVWRVVTADDSSEVSNGERILLHPHDNEQPFTRSQAGVTAKGTIRIEAADNIHGLGGSAIYLDLDSEFIKANGQLKVHFEIEDNP